MVPKIDEYYYFDQIITAAGCIKRWVGEDMVIRGMEFKEGECIGEDTSTFHFRVMIGNTLYYFKIGKYSNLPLYLLKPPS